MSHRYAIPSIASLGITLTACSASSDVVGPWRATSFGNYDNLPLEVIRAEGSDESTTTTYVAVHLDIQADYSVTLDVIYTDTTIYGDNSTETEHGGGYGGYMILEDDVYNIVLTGERFDLRMGCTAAAEAALNCEMSDAEEEYVSESIFVPAP